MAQDRNPYRTLAVWALTLLLLAGLGLQLWFTSSQSIAEAYMNRGIAALRQRHLDEALADYQRAETIDGRDATILYLLGVLQKERGDSRAAMDALSSSLELAPNEVATLTAYAELLAFSSDIATAEEILARALALAPASRNANHLAGLISGLKGDHAAAVNHFKNVLKLSGGGARLLSQLANALYEQGEYPEALRYADQALTNQKLFADYRLIRGKIMLAMNNLYQAARDLSWAEEMYARTGDGIRPEPGKLNDTRRHLYQVHVKGNYLSRAANNLAHLAVSKGPTDEVIAWAIDLEGRLNNEEGQADAKAQFHLGKALLAIDEFPRAQKAFVLAGSNAPESMRATVSILHARALLGSGKPADALRILKALGTPDPPDSEYLLALGSARAGIGDFAGAREAYNAVFEAFDVRGNLLAYVEEQRDALPR